MTQVTDIMTRDVQSIGPKHCLRDAAQRMKELDVGSLPVTDGDSVVGVITDRDIAIRGMANGLSPAEACVDDVMTREPLFCSPDDSVADVMALMGVQQLRRLPVVQKGRLVGIVALADLARRQDDPTDRMLRDISDPGSDDGNAQLAVDAGTGGKHTGDMALQGEGDRRADRRYRSAARRFAESGKVAPAAAAAEPKSMHEAQEMRAAEIAGRRKARH